MYFSITDSSFVYNDDVILSTRCVAAMLWFDVNDGAYEAQPVPDLGLGKLGTCQGPPQKGPPQKQTIFFK